MENEIQQMNQRIQAVQMKIETMDQKIKALKQRIQGLKQQMESADECIKGSHTRVSRKNAKIEENNERINVEIKKIKSMQENGGLRFDRWLELFTREQALGTQRYQELKTGLEDVYTRLSLTATEEQLNHVYKSLSQDILCVAGDYHQLKKRVKPLLKKGLQT